MELQDYLTEITPQYSGYQELHVHSDGSYRDAVNRVEDIFDMAEKLGRKAVAITDHGNMTRLFKGLKERTKREKKALEAALASAGVPEEEIKSVLGHVGAFDSIRNPTPAMEPDIRKYGECFVTAVRKTVQFVPGIEMYATDGPEDHTAGHHIIFYATDWLGMKQLFKICNTAQLLQYRRQPQVTFETLEQFVGPGTVGHGHVIATSACVGGHLCKILLRPQKIQDRIDALTQQYDEMHKVDPQQMQRLKDDIAKQEALREQARADRNESKKAAARKIQSRLDRQQKKLTELLQKQSANPMLLSPAKEKLEEQIREAERKCQETRAEYEENKHLADLLPEREKALSSIEASIKTYKDSLRELEKQAAPQVRIQEKISAAKKEKESLGDVYALAKETALHYASIFGPGCYYIELQKHGIDKELYCEPFLRKIAAETGIPLTVANDVHYATPKDEIKRNIVTATGWGKTLNEIASMSGNDQLYFKSNEEMAALFPNDQEALENTAKIAAKCNVYYKKEMHLPEFDTKSELTPKEYLEQNAVKNIPMKYPDFEDKDDAWKNAFYERLHYELDVIEKMGYSSYIAIVQDFVQYGRSISGPELVGPGRGSAAGSLVCYLLDITDIDPLRYGLIFERFLNPDRVSMPDIDTDFAMSIRDQVVDYVTKRYAYHGEYPKDIADTVCAITAEGTLGGRAAVRSVGRVLELPYDVIDRTAKMIPSTVGITLTKALEENPDLQTAYQTEPLVKQLLDDALLIEGLPDHATVHAAGVIIADKPVSEYAALFWNEKKNVWAIQYDMVSCEADIGLLKMDFLSLRNLDILGETKRLIRKDTGTDLNFKSINKADDPKVIREIFATGKTVGVFQFESGGMQQTLVSFIPKTIDDVALMNAAYRPGPMQYIPDIIDVKLGKKKPTYVVPQMKDILGPTYGKPVFQEQIQQIFHQIAGFSLGQADIIRRAMSKKHLDELVQYKGAFVDGLLKRGAKKTDVEAFWEELLEFAKYAFNKSHAVAYSIIAYYTAFLKLYYPVQYTAALMTYFPQKIALYLRDGKERGILLLKPNVNRSDCVFATTDDGNILFGLSRIKGVANAASAIVQERAARGSFKSYRDFVIRMILTGVGKGVIENLILSGALDSLIKNRKQQYSHLEEYVASCRAVVNKLKKRMDESDIDALYQAVTENWVAPVYPPEPYFSKQEALEYEKEKLGFYASGHPLDEYADILTAKQTDNIVSLEEDETATIAGQIQNLQMLNRRSDGKQMCKFVLEDLSDEIEVICFTKTYEKVKGFIKEGAIVAVEGRADFETGDQNEEKVVLSRQFVAQNITSLERNQKMVIQASLMDYVDKIQPLLETCPKGSTTVFLNEQVCGNMRKTQYNICVTDELTKSLTELQIPFAV